MVKCKGVLKNSWKLTSKAVNVDSFEQHLIERYWCYCVHVKSNITSGIIVGMSPNTWLPSGNKLYQLNTLVIRIHWTRIGITNSDISANKTKLGSTLFSHFFKNVSLSLTFYSCWFKINKYDTSLWNSGLNHRLESIK